MKREVEALKEVVELKFNDILLVGLDRLSQSKQKRYTRQDFGLLKRILNETNPKTVKRIFNEGKAKGLFKSYTMLNSLKGAETHWEKIESYYVDRLDALSKEIESSTLHNNKLTTVREELLAEILKLHQKSIDLNNKNESLIRSIAEKENHISAFMYQEPTVGVTLVDPPYSLAPSTPVSNTPTASTSTAPTPPVQYPKKEPGIFRQISLRLSSRKKRHHEETSLNISDPIPIASSSEPLLHPAAVVQTVFGNDLIDQARLEKSVIPSVVLKCIREVESRGLHVEGIYRKSGTFGHVKELKIAFNENKQPKLSNYDDIHVITNLLKLYLRDLPSPVLSKDFTCKVNV
ncbi:hypothetical protein INT48_002776 [Thamnidium elegans]|uniref:Rho-GAP domain-containing protein n=1 Tax=Thamnidium elegans TaxID=101142 RepID=A0A8H7SMR1_9FUNG|nr:hypothetical protein INT48_002776 [Thamnidium elegans]